MNRQQQADKAKPRDAGPRIPDKPRDCGPNVDTWPILDIEPDASRKPKSGSSGKPKARPP